MKTYTSLLTLIAELDGSMAELNRILDYNTRAWERIQNGATDPIDWGSLAYTIHTLYGIAENYFLRISNFFENNLSPERWHRELVEKMALEIPQVRPALLVDSGDKQLVLDILKYRHRFINYYGEDLDPVKTMEIQEKIRCFFSSFPQIHANFRAKILAIAEVIR